MGNAGALGTLRVAGYIRLLHQNELLSAGPPINPE
jgi:hypothetical protein